MLQEIKNLIEEKKLQIIEELRDAAQITLETYEDEGEDVSGIDLGDIVWNFVDDASYEYVEVLRWVLGDDINEDVWIKAIDENWSGAIPATLIYNKNKRKFYEHSFDYETLEKELQTFIN